MCYISMLDHFLAILYIYAMTFLLCIYRINTPSPIIAVSYAHNIGCQQNCLQIVFVARLPMTLIASGAKSVWLSWPPMSCRGIPR